MAFVKQQFGNPSDAAVGNLPTLYHYWSTADTVATIIASAYFDDLTDSVVAGDVIYIKGSDTAEYVEVTSDTGVTPVTVESITGSAGDAVTYVAQATSVGGAATEVFTAAGVVATDVVSAVLHTVGAAPVTITSAAAGAGNISVVFSADPAADHVVNFIVVTP